MSVIANSSSASAASNTIFELNTKISGGYDSTAFGVDASLEASMESADTTRRDQQSLNVTLLLRVHWSAASAQVHEFERTHKNNDSNIP
jgi:hypothetical protein